MTVAASDGGPSDQTGSTTMQSAENELWDSFQLTTEALPGGQFSGGGAGDSVAGFLEQAAHASVAGGQENTKRDLEKGEVLGPGPGEEVGALLQDASHSEAPKQAPQADVSSPGVRQSDRLQSRPGGQLRTGSTVGTSPRAINPFTHARNPLTLDAHVAAVAAQKLNGLAADQSRPEVAPHLQHLSVTDEVQEGPSSTAGAISPVALPDAAALFDRDPSVRPTTRTGGSYKTPDSPLGLVSPRAGVTSTAVLALPAPDRPVVPGVKRRAKALPGVRSVPSEKRGGPSQNVFVGVPQPIPEGSRQSDAEEEQSGSGLLEGGLSAGVSGRSGTTSGGKVPRECSVCHLNKSPRWRTGPEGPKTLCNRCGVYWSQNRHKWDELVDRFKATSDGEVNQLQAEFKAVRHAKSADLEQKRAKVVRAPPRVPKALPQGAGNVREGHRPRKASNLGRSEGHSRSDTETILQKLQELPGHFAKSLRKELLGFGLVRSASPKPDAEGGQGGQSQQQAEAVEEEVVISSGSDDEGAHEQARGSSGAGLAGRASETLMQVSPHRWVSAKYGSQETLLDTSAWGLTVEEQG